MTLNNSPTLTSSHSLPNLHRASPTLLQDQVLPGTPHPFSTTALDPPRLAMQPLAVLAAQSVMLHLAASADDVAFQALHAPPPPRQRHGPGPGVAGVAGHVTGHVARGVTMADLLVDLPPSRLPRPSYRPAQRSTSLLSCMESALSAHRPAHLRPGHAHHSHHSQTTHSHTAISPAPRTLPPLEPGRRHRLVITYSHVHNRFRMLQFTMETRPNPLIPGWLRHPMYPRGPPPPPPPLPPPLPPSLPPPAVIQRPQLQQHQQQNPFEQQRQQQDQRQHQTHHRQRPSPRAAMPRSTSLPAASPNASTPPSPVVLGWHQLGAFFSNPATPFQLTPPDSPRSAAASPALPRPAETTTPIAQSTPTARGFRPRLVSVTHALTPPPREGAPLRISPLGRTPTVTITIPPLQDSPRPASPPTPPAPALSPAPHRLSPGSPASPPPGGSFSPPLPRFRARPRDS